MNIIELLEYLHDCGLKFEITWFVDGSYHMVTSGNCTPKVSALIDARKNEIQAYYAARSNGLDDKAILRLENYRWAVEHDIYTDTFTAAELRAENAASRKRHKRWSLDREEPETFMSDGILPAQVAA